MIREKVNGEKDFAGLAGEYTYLDHGSFKLLYVNRENDSLLYAPIKGGSIEGQIQRVLTWEHNIETLEEHDVPLPFDDHDVLVTEAAGMVEPLLCVDYEKDLQTGDELDFYERRRYEDEWEAYQDIVDELRETGELAISPTDTGAVKKSNYGVHREDGPVLLDFGEILLTATGVTGRHDTKQEFYQEHGIDERASEILTNPGTADEVTQAAAELLDTPG